MGKIERFLDTPVNLGGLVTNLEWDEDLFEEAVRNQPKLYLEAARYRALKARRKARAKYELNNVTAEIKQMMRRKRDEGERLTETAMSERATLHSQVRTAQRKLDEAYVHDQLAESIMEAYRQRGQMLKIIAEIRASEVASQIRSVRENLARDEMHELSDRTRAAFKGVGK